MSDVIEKIMIRVLVPHDAKLLTCKGWLSVEEISNADHVISILGAYDKAQAHFFKSPDIVVPKNTLPIKEKCFHVLDNEVRIKTVPATGSLNVFNVVTRGPENRDIQEAALSHKDTFITSTMLLGRGKEVDLTSILAAIKCYWTEFIDYCKDTDGEDGFRLKINKELYERLGSANNALFKSIGAMFTEKVIEEDNEYELFFPVKENNLSRALSSTNLNVLLGHNKESALATLRMLANIGGWFSRNDLCFYIRSGSASMNMKIQALAAISESTTKITESSTTGDFPFIVKITPNRNMTYCGDYRISEESETTFFPVYVDPELGIASLLVIENGVVSSLLVEHKEMPGDIDLEDKDSVLEQRTSL